MRMCNVYFVRNAFDIKGVPKGVTFIFFNELSYFFYIFLKSIILTL